MYFHVEIVKKGEDVVVKNDVLERESMCLYDKRDGTIFFCWGEGRGQ